MKEGLTTDFPLADLHEAADNPREITDERFDALKHSITSDPDFMQARPIIVDADNGDVVAGNMRLRALKELGRDSAPVFVKKFTSAGQRREWMLRDNQEYGEWVPDELAALVKAHAEEEGDLRLLGFTEENVDSLLALADGEEAPAGGSGGGGGGGIEAEVWGVIVDCDDEDQQLALLEELAGRGLQVRALIA